MCLCAAVVPAWTSYGLILTSAITLASRAPAILAEAPIPRGLGVGPCIILCPAPFRGRLHLEARIEISPTFADARFYVRASDRENSPHTTQSAATG